MHASVKARISEAELIITPRGTVYHIDLAPEHIADTVITVGDPGRVAEVSKYFDRITHQTAHREFVSHTGLIRDKQLTVLSTGIGPDNIDIVFNELDALANIDFATRTVNETKRSLNIIRLGTCGGLQAGIPLDSIVVSSYGIGMDNLLHYYRLENNSEEAQILDAFNRHTGMLAQTRIMPYIAEGSISLRKHFGSGFYHGITVTCPGFYGPQGRVLRLPVAMPTFIDSLMTFTTGEHRITNFEMETSAMYGLARLMGHKTLSISAVVANRAAGTFSADGGKAVDNMIRKSLEVIVNGIL